MTKQDLITHAQNLSQLAVRLANKPAPTAKERASLHAASAALLQAIEAWKPAPRAANAAKVAVAETVQFTITWRGSGQVDHITGLAALAKRLGFMPSTVRRLMSAGKGQHKMALNPIGSDIADSVVVEQLGYTPGVGRPRKQVDGEEPAKPLRSWTGHMTRTRI